MLYNGTKSFEILLTTGLLPCLDRHFFPPLLVSTYTVRTSFFSFLTGNDIYHPCQYKIFYLQTHKPCQGFRVYISLVKVCMDDTKFVCKWFRSSEHKRDERTLSRI